MIVKGCALFTSSQGMTALGHKSAFKVKVKKQPCILVQDTF